MVVNFLNINLTIFYLEFLILSNTLSNDHVAIVHAEISKETEQALVDVLGVEVFRLSLGENALVIENISLKIIII